MNYGYINVTILKPTKERVACTDILAGLSKILILKLTVHFTALLTKSGLLVEPKHVLCSEPGKLTLG